LGDPDLQNNVLLTGIAGNFACFDCAGLHNEFAMFVPLSLNLLYGRRQEKTQVIMVADQDIVVLTMQCFSSRPQYSLDNNTLRFNVTNSTPGLGTASIIFTVASKVNYNGEIKERTCTVVTYDRKGHAGVRYGLTQSGTASRLKVEYIEPPASGNCTEIYGKCLGPSDRDHLSEGLISSFLPFGVIEIDQDYSLTSGSNQLIQDFFPILA
jgi:hypothetical protein